MAAFQTLLDHGSHQQSATYQEIDTVTDRPTPVPDPSLRYPSMAAEGTG